MQTKITWLSVFDQSPAVYEKAHSLACASAGDGETPTDLPYGFRPCFDRVLMVADGHRRLVYSMDPTSGELSAELIGYAP
jgi:hypothetical protein